MTRPEPASASTGDPHGSPAPVTPPVVPPVRPPAPAVAPGRPSRAWKILRLVLGLLVLLFGVLPLTLIVLYRFHPPPTTPLMQIRARDGLGEDRRWRDLASLPLPVRAGALAAEDGDFCQHYGIDWAALRGALARHQAGGALTGASTLPMQLVRSLLLWPDRSYLRKGLELLYAPVADAVWGKRRALELYLNLAEWGPGIYGIEAAARHWYGVGAEALDREQVARLYAILPSPQTWDPRSEHPSHRARWQRIVRRLGRVRIGRGDPCENPQPLDPGDQSPDHQSPDDRSPDDQSPDDQSPDHPSPAHAPTLEESP